MSTHMPLDCDGFAAELADYLEGDAPDAVRDAVEAHAARCAACRQLLEDLGSLRHEAAALPTLVPSRDLWAGISERIDAKVLPFESDARTIQPARRSWARPAIAAAALVIVTAGITHLATRQSMKQTATSAPTRTQQVAIAAPVQSDSELSTVASSTSQPAVRSGAALATARTAGRPGASSARLASAEPLMKATEPVYDREILKLRSIVTTRREQLDPKTVAVLEQSIAVIDSAIAQSRAALAKDPASGFLATQLNHSLEKKVELLRTAALLPART
ncbi:MAG: hypothetical protein JWL95_1608 [Gemmatimonadetes bacterium]|nr:hypothetical protein [Gemmatimonadota bacterium]